MFSGSFYLLANRAMRMLPLPWWSFLDETDVGFETGRGIPMSENSRLMVE